MITTEWFEDTDGTIYCHDRCKLWDRESEMCVLDFDTEDRGIPGKDCPGPGEYEVTLEKDNVNGNSN